VKAERLDEDRKKKKRINHSKYTITTNCEEDNLVILGPRPQTFALVFSRIV
jgi:hypothetical protein